MSKRTTDVIATLRRVPYLTGVALDQLTVLAGACSERHLRAGGRLFSEGDPPSGVYVLLSGRVKVVRTSRSGREQVLHQEGPGATLGEVPVFDGQGYVGSAVALDACAALFVPRRALLQILEQNPGAAAHVVRVLSGRVRRLALLAADLSLRDTTQRVAAHVLREAERGGRTVVLLKGTREELATRLGTVREEVSRALSQLRAQGILDVAGRRIRVLDAKRLRARAGDDT